MIGRTRLIASVENVVLPLRPTGSVPRSDASRIGVRPIRMSAERPISIWLAPISAPRTPMSTFCPAIEDVTSTEGVVSTLASTVPKVKVAAVMSAKMSKFICPIISKPSEAKRMSRSRNS